MNIAAQQKSAITWCEEILEGAKLGFCASEELQKLILMRGGKYFKTSNLERRCRQSSRIRSKLIKSNGTRYAVYGYANDEKQGELI